VRIRGKYMDWNFKFYWLFLLSMLSGPLDFKVLKNWFSSNFKLPIAHPWCIWLAANNDQRHPGAVAVNQYAFRPQGDRLFAWPWRNGKAVVFAPVLGWTVWGVSSTTIINLPTDLRGCTSQPFTPLSPLSADLVAM